MKKKISSFLLAICMVVTLLPVAAFAAEEPQFQFNEIFRQMNVGETVQLGYEASGGTPVFTIQPKNNATIDENGVFTALRQGSTEVSAHINGVYVGMCVIMIWDKTSTDAGTTSGNKKVWPFVPSETHRTDGKIHSDWYILFTHDLGTFEVSESGVVRPSRRERTPFYFEHLGKEVYYIRDVMGNYLAYQGSATAGAQVVFRKTPCKWKIDLFYDWQKKYMLTPYENTDYTILTYCLCHETEDSMVKLGKAWGNNGMQAQQYYTLQGQLQPEYLPQWYKDYTNGEPAPTTGIEKPQTLGAVPPELSETTQEEWDVLRLTNMERAKAGLNLLVTFNNMQKAAGIRSKELMELYDHTRPNGSSCFTVLDTCGIAETTAGENIALGATTPKNVVEGWMNSPGHKANILNGTFRFMGTGYSPDDLDCWGQLFATTANSDCASIVYNDELGYFKLKLQNGATAYAPYDPASSPTVNGAVTFRYPGVGTIGDGALKAPQPMENGWYQLRTMGNYYNLTTDGYAELRNISTNMAYYVENKGDGRVTLKLADGKYLGLAGSIQNGVRVKVVSKPYLWVVYSENGEDIYSLRPTGNRKMVMNASEEKKADGTRIILWSHPDLDAPHHAEIRFIPLFPQ